MALASSARPLQTPRHFARGLEGFRLRRPIDLQSTGIAELDAILGGGFPRGSIVELCGSASSGRTSVSFSLLAKATERQETCAYVDVSDSLDPMSLASAGVDLQRLLWIRCGAAVNSTRSEQSSSRLQSSRAPQGHTLPFLENNREKSKRTQVWQHPRDQIRGIETSLPAIMRNSEERKHENQTRKVQPIKSPSSESTEMPVIARCTGEQLETARESYRQRVVTETPEAPWSRNSSQHVAPKSSVSNDKPWKKLEQALKTTDLLLHSGGWGVVVFDLGNISWVDARRIELSTWFRFRRAIENTPTILLLLGEDSCAKSCSSLVLHCQRKRENWSCLNPQNRTSGVAILEGFEVEGQVVNSRIGLQPMDSACWKTKTLWTDSF